MNPGKNKPGFFLAIAPSRARARPAPHGASWGNASITGRQHPSGRVRGASLECRCTFGLAASNIHSFTNFELRGSELVLRGAEPMVQVNKCRFGDPRVVFKLAFHLCGASPQRLNFSQRGVHSSSLAADFFLYGLVLQLSSGEVGEDLLSVRLTQKKRGAGIGARTLSTAASSASSACVNCVCWSSASAWASFEAAMRESKVSMAADSCTMAAFIRLICAVH